MALPAGSFSVPPGVRLGMSARDLEKARPKLQLPEYGSRWERVDSTVIGYDFPEIQFGGEQINLKTGLRGISISLQLGSSAEARTRWEQLTNAIVGIHGPPEWCEEIHGRSPGIQAHWNLSGLALQVVVREPPSTGSEVAPDRVVLRITREEAAPHPEGVRIPCPGR
jgi:hypothetical protein